MRVLVVGSKHDQPGEEANLAKYGNYFQDAAGKQHQVSSALIDDLIFDISSDKFSIYDTANNQELSDYGLIIMRGKLRDEIDTVFAISEYAAYNNLSHFNDYRKVRSISKLAQAVNFFLMGLPFPRTIYASPQQLQNILASGKFSYPFVYKSRLGAHGDSNYLINSKEEFDKVTAWGMLAQSLIPNDGDYRVVVLGDGHLVIKRKAQPGTHLNNTSKGGNAELIKDFSQEIVAQSHRLAKDTGMTAAGVDVIIDKNDGRHYFLEINSQPQLMSGAFLADKKELVAKFLSTLDH